MSRDEKRYNDLPKSKRQQYAMQVAKERKVETVREFVQLQSKLSSDNPSINNNPQKQKR